MTDDLEHCHDEKKIKEQESVNGLDFLNATYGYQELTLIGNFFEHLIIDCSLCWIDPTGP